MNSLPSALGGGDLILWRLDSEKHAATWDSGEGARLHGGRWNPVGRRVVYASLDAATAILEVAVHKKFSALDTVPHALTWASIDDPASVYVVRPGDVPNPHWLRPGTPGAGQQHFGDSLLTRHAFVVLPSAVSTHSWNVLFDPVRAGGRYTLVAQERFALDTRLHPA